MYYYLVSPPKNYQEKKLQEKTRQIASEFGIGGETAMPSPARTVEELVKIAFSKNYTTIVALGNDDFCNRIASAMIIQCKPDMLDRLVLGIVPADYGSFLAVKVGINNLKGAMETLRQRRLKKIAVGLIEPNKFFILPLQINQSYSFFQIGIEFEKYTIKSTAFQAVIFPEGKIEIKDRPIEKGLFRKVAAFFTTNEARESISRFHASNFRLLTDRILDLKSNNEIIAKTPLRYLRANGILQLIISRDKIN